MKNLFTKNKTVLILSIILFTYSFIGFVVVPLATQFILPGKLEKIVKRDVDVQRISLNPFLFTIKVKNFEILTKDKKHKFAGFDELYINLNFISSLFKLAPVIDEIKLDSFSSYISKIDDETFNFSDLIPNEGEKKEEPEKKAAPENKDNKIPEFLIKKIDLKNLSIIFDDKPFLKKHEIKGLNIDSSIISSFEKDKDLPVHINLNSKINGADLKIDLKSLVFSKDMKTDVLFGLNNVELPFYYAYLEDILNFVPKSGVFGVDLDISFQKKNQLELSGKAGLKNLDLRDKTDKELISCKNFSIGLNKSYPLKKNININEIILDGFRSEIKRENQVINILNLVKSQDKKEENKDDIKKESNNKKENNFLLNIDKTLLTDMGIGFTDFDAPLYKSGYLKEPVKNRISNINLSVFSFTTKEKEVSDLVFNALINEKTKIDLKGKFAINPVFADIYTEIKDFSFAYSKGYIPPEIKVLVEKGNLDLKINNTLKMENEKLSLKALGDISLKELKLIERDTKKDFFNLDNFEIKGIDFDLDPKKIKIEEIIISGIDQEIIIEKNKELNLSRIIEKDEKKEESREKEVKAADNEKSKKDVFPINIPLIKFDNLALNYTDKSLTPYFSTGVVIESGEIKGLSTNAFAGADLDIKGKIDKTSPVLIKGKINPLLKDLLLDLKIDLNHLNLAILTPYSGKFIGRAIEKGQLNLDLYYDIKNRKLNADNKVLIDQFTLGRNIKSKDALNLPVGFAISLLKDRNGEINLDVPVRGDFDDPKFKVGRVIFSTLKNIVVKAAASPFALVASITGGGEDLKYIEFEYGKTDFKKSSINKLNSVKKLLFERPGLKLDVTGYSDIEKDSIILKKEIFETFINKEKIKKGIDADGNLKAKEYAKILESIYLEISGKKFESAEDKVILTELENALINSIKIDNEELRLLGLKRAEKIKEVIISSGKINASRVFVKDASKIMPKNEKGISFARGELGLE